MNPDPDARLLAGLRAGEEADFVELVRRYSPALMLLARAYAPTPAAAEEVVRETWLSVLTDPVEGATVKTWLFRAVAGRARTRGAPPAPPEPEPSVDPKRFLPADHPKWPGHWADDPPPIVATAAHVRDAIEGLPPMLRLVITLRDVDGWAGAEVCEALALSESDQRLLLHRARSRVRARLEAIA